MKNDKWETWKLFGRKKQWPKILFRHLPGRNEGNHEQSQPGLNRN
jgi:hypothetical protein